MTLRLVLIYVFFMAAASTRAIYFPYWMQSLGMSTADIGLVLAVTTLISIVSQPLLTSLCDRWGQPRRFLQLCLLFAWLLILPMPWLMAPLLLAAVLWVQQPPYSVTIHVLDIILLRQKGHEGFGKVRLWGSLSYGLTVAVYGFTMSRQSYNAAGKWAVWLYIVFFGLTMLAAFSLPRSLDEKAAIPSEEESSSEDSASIPEPSAKPSQDDSTLSIWGLFRLPGLLLFLFFNALHWVAIAFYDGFLSLHTKSLGLSNFVPGAAILAAVTAESVALYFTGALMKRWSPAVWLLLVFPMGALRWLGTAFATSATAIIALQTLHFFSYGVWLVVMMRFLDRFAPKGQRIGVQGLFAAVTFGIGGGFGQWSGGWLMQNAGGNGLYLVGAVLEVCAFAGLLLTLSRWNSRTKREEANV